MLLSNELLNLYAIIAVVKFSGIVKICKYRELHEGHHFISMVMEMHDAFWHDMDRFIRECARTFHDR
jgi:hypothetical protein